MRTRHNIFRELIKEQTKYNLIRNSPKAPTSKFFGITSIICSALTVVMALLFGVAINLLDGKVNPVMLIFLIIMILGSAVGFLICSILSLTKMIYQFKMNRHKIKWVAFSCFWISLLAGAAIILVFLTSI